MNDYFNEERTILVTTHQVEEVENLFTDVLFINHGRVVLDSSVEQLAERYVQLTVAPANVAQARALQPFYEREVFGRVVHDLRSAGGPGSPARRARRSRRHAHSLHSGSVRRENGGGVSTPSAVVSRPATSGWRTWAASNPRLRMFETLVRREFWSTAPCGGRRSS